MINGKPDYAAGEFFPGELVKWRWTPHAIANLIEIDNDRSMEQIERLWTPLLSWVYARNPAFTAHT